MVTHECLEEVSPCLTQAHGLRIMPDRESE